jgi:hypothetical protein
VAAVAAYITTIYVLERRGLVFGAAAGGAEQVSAYRNIPLPPPTDWNPRDDTGRAHVTQSTCLIPGVLTACQSCLPDAALIGRGHK